MEITNEYFDELVADGFVLIEFWAEWCQSCKMMVPVLDSIAETMSDQISVLKIDIEGSMNISEKCDVLNLPTMILFKDGTEVGRIVGAVPESKIMELIDGHYERNL